MAFEGDGFTHTKEAIAVRIKNIIEAAIKPSSETDPALINDVGNWLGHALDYYPDFACAQLEVLTALQKIPDATTFIIEVNQTLLMIRMFKLRERAVKLLAKLGECDNRVCFASVREEIDSIHKEGRFVTDGYAEKLRDFRVQMLERAVTNWSRYVGTSQELVRLNLNQIARELTEHGRPIQDPAILEIIGN